MEPPGLEGSAGTAASGFGHSSWRQARHILQSGILWCLVETRLIKLRCQELHRRRPATLKCWLDDRDVLLLIDRRGEPLVFVRWGAWRRLAESA